MQWFNYSIACVLLIIGACYLRGGWDNEIFLPNAGFLGFTNGVFPINYVVLGLSLIAYSMRFKQYALLLVFMYATQSDLWITLLFQNHFANFLVLDLTASVVCYLCTSPIFRFNKYLVLVGASYMIATTISPYYQLCVALTMMYGYTCTPRGVLVFRFQESSWQSLDG